MALAVADTPQPPRAPLGLRLLRGVFRVAARERPTRALVRRHWPAMTLEVDGLRMRLHPGDNTTERRIWLTGRADEEASIAQLVALIRGRDALVLDIGANCGAFTLPLAAALGDGGRVLCFEPNPVMADRLADNIALNGLAARTEILRCALGAGAGTARLNLHGRNFGQSSLRAVAGASDAIEVPVRPVADYAARAADHGLFVIKIDVEGVEDRVLMPLLDDPGLPLPDAILIETEHAHVWEGDLTGALSERGYVAAFEGDGNTLFRREGAA